MANPIINAGWPEALPALEGSGVRWWLTPWLTSAAAEGRLRPGDRVIIRGLPQDFADGMSNLEAVAKLVEQGVEVRRHARLHAKAYAREADGFVVGWIGSANLSWPGKSDGTKNANIEAMAGPLLFPPEEATKIRGLWEAAAPFDIEAIRSEVAAYEERRNLEEIIRAAQNVLLIRLSFSVGQSRLTLKERWFKQERPTDAHWRNVEISLPFIVEEHPLSRAWNAYRNTLTQGLKQHFMASVTGPIGRGLYVILANEREVVRGTLERAKQHLHTAIAGGEIKEQLGQAFWPRFQEVLKPHERHRGLATSQKDLEREVAIELHGFLQGRPFTLNYAFFIPIINEDDEVSAAIRSIKSRQGELFAADATAEDKAEEVLAQAEAARQKELQAREASVQLGDDEPPMTEPK